MAGILADRISLIDPSAQIPTPRVHALDARRKRGGLHPACSGHECKGEVFAHRKVLNNAPNGAIFCTVGSPFIYEEPVEPPDLLADRTEELALLKDRAAETRNSRLEGPRRYGKTSLLKAALAAAEKDGFVPIYVNFLGVLTVADITERVERAYRGQLDGPLRQWFAGSSDAAPTPESSTGWRRR